MRSRQFALLLAALGAGGCGADGSHVGVLEEAVLDEKWWQNPLFQGSTPYKFQDGHTWYDSDIGGGYVTGSWVRLPVDANYIADWQTGPVKCNGGGTSSFWSPVFQTTVNGKTTNWVFNHLSKSFLGANGRTKGWYNGGALVGETGGGTCDTGMPTFSTGPHFCNEMRDYDPYTYWKPVPTYQSNCMNSNGTSGVANPVCGGMQQKDPCKGAANGNGPYCGGGLPGGNPALLYDCQNGATAGTTQCACGCMINPPKVPDACKANCNDPCASAKLGNGGYCGGGLTGGDANLLYDCQNGVTKSTTVCKCGCMVNPPKVPDVCALTCAPTDDMAMAMMPAVDMAATPSPPDQSQSATGDGDVGGGPNGALVTGGCSVSAHANARSPAVAILLFLLMAALQTRRRAQHKIPRA